MKASFVDLRKKSSEIIRAINRKERITVLYRGKPAAVMQSIHHLTSESGVRAQDHPAFGLWAARKDLADVAAHVRELRKGRHHAL